MNLEQIRELDKKYYMNTFGDRTPVAFESGEGIRLKAVDGTEYTDFFAGIAVNSLGYAHPRLVRELCDQIGKLTHISNVYYTENQARLAQMLAENSCADRVFFANTGAEANEGAIKLVKKYFYQNGENRTEFVTLENSFHGRTLATVAATGQPKYQKPYQPLINTFKHVTANDCEQLKAAVSDKTAAIMLEVIQGESGVRPLTQEYLKLARELCDKHGAFLIIDEVQTGVGRTGKLFAYEHYGVEPDVFTLAKGLGGGVPIGAFCAKERLASAFTPGDHGTTFGGNPLAARAGLVVLDELLNNGVLENANAVGVYFGQRLEQLAQECEAIAEVRGIGLMRGVEFKEPIAKEIGQKLMEKRYIVGTVGTSVLRLVPPLIVTKEDIDGFIDTLKGVMTEC
uniref:Acetylornithine aminotransferase n=1 Tax=uncultured Bacillota bacterium TaxID=344338 RepID=A0A650EP93_9FIRM|nr:acetylornithine aminotransferase [uncultured Firmicutes bacterium]